MLNSIKLHQPWIAMIGFVVPWIGTLNHGAHATDTQAAETKNESSTIDADKLLNEVRGVRQDIKLLTELVERRLSVTESRLQKSAEPSKPVAEPNASTISASPSALFFMAKWCGPCQSMVPDVAKLIHDGYPIQVIDIDSDKELSKKYQITAIPRFSIVDGESVIISVEGRQSLSQLQKLLETRNVKTVPDGIFWLEASLQKKVTLHFDDAPLIEVLREFKKQIDVNLVIDDVGLQEMGVTSAVKISIDVDNVLARSALKLITQRLSLGYILENEVISVTSANRAEGNLFAVVYPISDLMNKKLPASDESKRIIDIICKVVAPESWEEAGGNATIRCFPDTKSLVINTTKPKHDAIHALVAALCELKTVAAAPTHELRRETVDPLEARAYSVADLIRSADAKTTGNLQDEAVAWLRLIEGIRESVDPDAWEENGGESTIRFSAAHSALVIRTTTATHEKIHNLFETLRRARETTIAFDGRIVQLPETDVKKLIEDGTTKHARVRAFPLKDSIVDTFLKQIFSTGSDATRRIVAEPRMTAKQGEITHLVAPIHEAGLDLYFRGMANPEASQIRVNVGTNRESLINDLTRHSFNLTPGETLFFDLTEDFATLVNKEVKGRVVLLLQAKQIHQDEQQ